MQCTVALWPGLPLQKRPGWTSKAHVACLSFPPHHHVQKVSLADLVLKPGQTPRPVPGSPQPSRNISLPPPCTGTAVAQPYGFQPQPDLRFRCQLLLGPGQRSGNSARLSRSHLRSHAYPPLKHPSPAGHKSQVVVQGNICPSQPAGAWPPSRHLPSSHELSRQIFFYCLSVQRSSVLVPCQGLLFPRGVWGIR